MAGMGKGILLQIIFFFKRLDYFKEREKLTWEKERGLNSFALGFNVDFLTCLHRKKNKAQWNLHGTYATVKSFIPDSFF